MTLVYYQKVITHPYPTNGSGVVISNEKPTALKLMLTSTRKDLGKVHYTKEVDDFGILPESINAPLSNKWF
jgi:hypothetical protein